MLLDMGERVRMIFDCDEQMRRAIALRAARTGLGKSDVIVEALTKYLHDELEEAERALQKHGHVKPRKRD